MRMTTGLVKALVLITLLFSVQTQAAVWNISYPRPLTEHDTRVRYPVTLLTAALEQTGVKYTLLPSERILLQGRALSLLGENREVNVVWSMTDKSREQDLLPIRIPVYKGLIGWRIFLIHENSVNKFASIDKLDDLRDLTPLQGHDWPDTKIMQSNGFDVVTSNEYLGLFSLLARGQGDFFPRSVVEIWGEVDNGDAGEFLTIDSKSALRYPAAMYYFVNKKNTTLAKLIERGLEKVIASGEFDTLFMEEFEPVLKKANLAERRIYQLDNPLLPEKTPLSRKELWYQP